jgi:hypothetical protein
LSQVGCRAPLSASNSPSVVKVAVVGYLTHEPLQATVQSIKDSLAKYGDGVEITWYDTGTTGGSVYAELHGLTAHMNIVIDGKCGFQVDGRTVTFQGFEGEQWTRQDLNAVLAGLVRE